VAKQTFAMHLYARKPYFQEEGEYAFVLVPWNSESGSFGSYIGPVTVEAEVPDAFDMRSAQVKAKQEELQKVRAEFGAKVTQLQRELAELQAIEYVSEA
jgi:hypothetical protein